MKKLTLFDIKLECEIDKFSGFIAAENASEAEEMAREMVLADHLVWWAQEERNREIDGMAVEGKTPSEDDLDKILREQMEELEDMRLTMLVELGEVII